LSSVFTPYCVRCALCSIQITCMTCICACPPIPFYTHCGSGLDAPGCVAAVCGCVARNGACACACACTAAGVSWGCTCWATFTSATRFLQGLQAFVSKRCRGTSANWPRG
jgi:hypothetical protein